MMGRTTLDDRTIAERDLDDLIDYTLAQLDKLENEFRQVRKDNGAGRGEEDDQHRRAG
jgi:hypothetical protein